MYSSHTDIIQLKSRNEILDLVNDENVPYNEINLDDSNDSCRKRVDEAIAAADAEIDGYLRERYKVPLSEAPILVKYISRVLALEILFFRRMPDNMPESVTNEARGKRKMLENISKGIIGLGIEVTDSKPASGTYKTNKDSSDKIFTKDVLDQY